MPLPPIRFKWPWPSKKSSGVFEDGFAAGYQAAWETMLPLMQEGGAKSRQAIHDLAVEETLKRLDPLIAERLKETNRATLRPVAELISKYKQFQQALKAAETPEERAKYEHYLTAMTWSLNGDRPR